MISTCVILFQGKEKNIICTTEQLEEFLQQRNDIILDEVIFITVDILLF